jgi:membrane-associated phospholipid phosphatase
MTAVTVVTDRLSARRGQHRLVLACIALLARTAVAEPTDDTHRVRHLIGIGVAIGLYVTSETVAKDALAPDACRWCSPPGFDDSVHASLVWGDSRRAASISNLTGYALTPLGAAGLLLIASRGAADHWLVFSDDMIAVTEAAAYSQLVVQAVKFSVGRQRPYAHYHSPAYPTVSNDDNLSFLSGHSALTFSIATAAGTVAQRRHYALAPAIWATGLGLAATTAYLRLAGDKHYLSDVFAGGALGAAAGVFVPRLLHSLPDDIAIVPMPTGLSIAGAF